MGTGPMTETDYHVIALCYGADVTLTPTRDLSEDELRAAYRAQIHAELEDEGRFQEAFKVARKAGYLQTTSEARYELTERGFQAIKAHWTPGIQ
jgi:hypothetical protein